MFGASKATNDVEDARFSKAEQDNPPARGNRISVFPATVLVPMAVLIIGFWIIAVWMFGSVFEQQSKAANLKILVADMDGSNIGECLIASSTAISGQSRMASFELMGSGPASYEDVYDIVWEGKYWGAIVAMPNATQEFTAAVQEGNIHYEAGSLIRYIWNDVRWNTIAQSYIVPSFQSAVDGLNKCYDQNHTYNTLSEGSLPRNSTMVLLNGIQASAVNIQEFQLGIKIFLNTVGMVFPVLIQFFFSMTIGGVASLSKWYQMTATRWSYLNRLGLSLIFSCLIGISWGLWLEAYREQLDISGGQYCLVWLIYWMYGFIAFEYMDIISAFLKPPLLPVFVFAYVIVNVSASVFPIDVKPDFYHIDYIWPSYNCFELLITVLSHGSTSRIYRNVPVLFGWLIVWMPLGLLANKRRCAVA